MISDSPGYSPNDSLEKERLYVPKTIVNESYQKEKAHQVRLLVFLACILLLVRNSQRCGAELFESFSVKSWKHSTHVIQTGDVSFSANRNTLTAKNDIGYPSQFVGDPSRNIWTPKLIAISTRIFYGAGSPRDDSRHVLASITNERNNASPSSQNGGCSATRALRLVSSPSTSRTPTRTATINTTTSCTTVGSSTPTGSSSSSNPSTSSGSLDETIIQGSSIIGHTTTATPLGRPSSSIHDADEGRGSTSESNENVSVPSDEDAEYMQEDWDIGAERFVPLGNLVEGDFFAIDSGARPQRNNLTPTLETLGGLVNGLSTINPENPLPIANGIPPLPVNAVSPSVGVESVPEGNGLIDDRNQTNHHVHTNYSNVLSFATTPSPEVGRLLGSEYYNPIMAADIDRVQRLCDLEALCASIDIILPDNEEY